MENVLNVSNQDPPPQEPRRRHGHDFSKQSYKFSPEELRVLRQCNTESFYQRSLPIGTALGVATYLSVKSGYLRPSLRFGAVPKVAMAVIAGYFVGKFSYQQKCAEKLMALPNSQLGEMLRKRKNKGFGDSLSLDPGFSSPEGMESYSDIPPQQTYLDLDSDRPSNEGLDDSGRPSLDDMVLDDDSLPLPNEGTQRITSYEELRRRNREEYEMQKTKTFRPAPIVEEQPTVIRGRPIPTPGPAKEKTKYGDVWEQ